MRLHDECSLPIDLKHGVIVPDRKQTCVANIRCGWECVSSLRKSRYHRKPEPANSSTTTNLFHTYFLFLSNHANPFCCLVTRLHCNLGLLSHHIIKDTYTFEVKVWCRQRCCVWCRWGHITVGVLSFQASWCQVKLLVHTVQLVTQNRKYPNKKENIQTK